MAIPLRRQGTLLLVLVQLVGDPRASAGTMIFLRECRNSHQPLLSLVARFTLRPIGLREPARRALVPRERRRSS